MTDKAQEFLNESSEQEGETLSSTVKYFHESENSKKDSEDEFELKLDDDGSESADDSSQDTEEDNSIGKQFDQLTKEKIYTSEEDTTQSSVERMAQDREEEIFQKDKNEILQFAKEVNQDSEEESSVESQDTISEDDNIVRKANEEEGEQSDEKVRMQYMEEGKEVSEEETSQESKEQTSQESEETESQTTEEEIEQSGKGELIHSIEAVKEISDEEISQDSNKQTSQDEETGSQSNEEEFEQASEEFEQADDTMQSIEELNDIPVSEQSSQDSNEHISQDEDTVIQNSEEKIEVNNEDVKIQETEDEKVQDTVDEKMQETEDDKKMQDTDNGVKMQETEDDEKMQETEEDEKMQETKDDEKMQETEDDEKMQETEEDEKMQETEDDKKIQKTEYEKIQETVDEMMQETEDEKRQETEDEKVQETEDEKIQNTEDKKMQETEDENMQKTEDKDMQKTEDKDMQETDNEEMQKTEDKDMQETDDEEMQKTEDKDMQETEDEKVQETDDEEMQKTEDKDMQDTEDEKIQNTEDKKMQESDDEKMQKTEDKDVQETEDEKMQETEGEKIQKTEDETIQETEDENMQKTENENMPETEDENMPETEDENMSETEDENMPETEDENMPETEDENIQETEDENIQETEDENIQETKDENIQETKDENIQETEDENIQETEDENIQETEDENIQETEDENIQETEDEKIQEAEEVKEVTGGETCKDSMDQRQQDEGRGRQNNKYQTEQTYAEDAEQSNEDGETEQNNEYEMMQSVEEMNNEEIHLDEILYCEKVTEDGIREMSRYSKDQVLKKSEDRLRQTNEGEIKQTGIEETEQVRKEERTQSSEINKKKLSQDSKEEIEEDKETIIHANKKEIIRDNVEKYEQTTNDEVEQEKEEKAGQVMKVEMLKEVLEKKMDSSEKSEVNILQESNEDTLHKSDTEKSPVLGQSVKKKCLSLVKNKARKSESIDKDNNKSSVNIYEKESQNNRTSPIIGSRSKDSPGHCTSRRSSASEEERCDLVITSVQGNVSDFTSQESYSDLKKVKPTISADKSNESADVLCESEDEVIFEECKATVCQKCNNIWTDKVLKAIFKGTETVTVNSKITFGAMVLMNNWAFKNIALNKDTAVRKVLERAGLGKNIKSMKRQKLSHWLSGLMTKGKIKCCAVFDAIYKPKPIKLSSVAKDKEMECETLNVYKDVISNKRPLSPEEGKESYSGKSTKYFDPHWKVNVENEEPLICKQLGIDINSIDISGSSTDTKRISNGTVFKQSSKKSSYAELRMLKERSRLYEFAKEAFDLLPFEPENFYTSSGNKPSERFMTNRELLTLHSIFILDAEYPDAELLYKSLSQILMSRSQVLLIPDSRTLLQVLEKLRRDFNRAKARKAYSEFLSQNWDLRNVYSSEDVWSSRDVYPKNPSIGNILSLFCLWKNQRHEIYLSLSGAMEEMCKNTDLSSSDKLGICVRLYARFCTFLYKEDNPELAETFLCRKFTMSNISVTREILLSDMRCSTSENYSFELSVTNTEKEIALAIQNCLEAEKITLQSENDKTLKHYQKLLKIFEQKLTQYREVNSNIITKLRDAEARKQELVMKIQGPKSKILLEELSAGISTICRNKRKHSMLDKAHQTSVKRQRGDYVTEVLGQGTQTEIDTVSDEMKEMIHEILSKGVKPELVRVVIQTVIKKAVGESNLYLPDVIWIRKYAQENGFLTNDS